MVSLILLIIGLVLFVVAAFGLVTSKVNLVALGLAAWIAAVILGGRGY